MNPKKQKLHKMLEEKIEAVKVEVQRLLDVGFIREVTYLQCVTPHVSNLQDYGNHVFKRP
jgi:hypothetical protein